MIHRDDRGNTPLPRRYCKMTLQMILLGKIEYTYASPEAQSFINALLEPQPSKRLGSNLNDVKTTP